MVIDHRPDLTVRAERAGPVRTLSIGLFVLFAFSIIPGLFFREPWLWMDEVLSYVFVSDPSLAHMNDAVVSSMDANPPLYFNIVWFLGHAISLDPFFLRCLSVLLFAGTIVLFFRYTTRLMGDGVTNFVLISAIVYLTHLNFMHATGLRSYALLLPICCIYFILAHQLINKPNSLRLLVLHTLLGILVALCHNYGLFYLAASGAFFGCLLVWSKQRIYLPVLATFALMGIVWLLVWYPSFVIQSWAGQPHSWIPLPTLRSSFMAVGDLIPSPEISTRMAQFFSSLWVTMVRVGLMVALYVYLAVPKLKAGFQAMRQDRAFQFFLMSGFIYLTTIGIALAISLTYTSIFLSRYMWPSQLLVMFQLIYAYYHFFGERRINPRLARLLPVYGLLLGSVMFYKTWKLQSPFPDRILDYLPQLSARYPVFVERADYFLPIWFHNQRPNVSFLLDWKTANQPGNIRNATVDYKVLKAVKDRYNVSGVVTSDKFTAANFPHFYVVDERNVYQMEAFIGSGKVKVVRELPIGLPGHRLLECSF